jgi:hypothetical protein
MPDSSQSRPAGILPALTVDNVIFGYHAGRLPILLDKPFNKPNFRRNFMSFRYLVHCGESVKSGKHRSASLFEFDREKCASLERQGFNFSS